MTQHADTALVCVLTMCSQLGAVLGVAATGYLLKDNSAVKPLHFLGGAGVGAASGVLLHMMTRPLDQKTANKMMHELRN